MSAPYSMVAMPGYYIYYTRARIQAKLEAEMATNSRHDQFGMDYYWFWANMGAQL